MGPEETVSGRYVEIIQTLAPKADWLTERERKFCAEMVELISQNPEGEAAISPKQKAWLAELETKYS